MAYTTNSLNNAQLTQSLLIEQQFAGLPSINDTVLQEVNVTLPYLIDLYLNKTKATITYQNLHNLAVFSRYLIDESVKLEDYPVFKVRYTLTYDYTTVPPVNPLSETRTGKILFREGTNDFTYRFVNAVIPNGTTFDLYADSNIVVTDVVTTFAFGNLNFQNWLQSNRGKSVKILLETYFDAPGNFTIKDMIDYITLNRQPSNDVIKYLSNSLELLESLS